MRVQTRGISVLEGVALVILALVLLAFVLPVVAGFYYIRKMAQENPVLRTLPQPLPAVASLQAKPVILTCYGLQFSVPWGKPIERSENENVTQFRFPGGRSLLIEHPGLSVGLVDFVFAGDPDYRKDIQKTFGLEGVETSYDFCRKFLEATPKELSLFYGPKKFISTFLTISQKLALVEKGSTGIFSFEFGELRGFQINDPVLSREVKVYAFEKDDGYPTIRFTAQGESNHRISQAEINFVVQSLRRAPEEKKPEKVAPQPAKKPSARKTVATKP